MLSGYYIVNAASGKVLDDPAFSTSNGAVIQQYQLNGGANQQWDLVPLNDGNYEVVNAYSGKVLDDPAFSTSNGTLIQQYQLNGGQPAMEARRAGERQLRGVQRVQRQGARRPGVLDQQRHPDPAVPAQRGSQPAVEAVGGG